MEFIKAVLLADVVTLLVLAPLDLLDNEQLGVFHRLPQLAQGTTLANDLNM